MGGDVKKLHFFYGVGWTASEGLPVGEYVVRYADDTIDTIPIEYGRDVRDWWMYEFDKKETPRAVIAWKGMNHAFIISRFVHRGQDTNTFGFIARGRHDATIRSGDSNTAQSVRE